MSTTTTPVQHGRRATTAAPGRRPGLGAALSWETRKLRAQLRTKALLAGTVLVPFGVVLVMHAQPRPPKDTLFGRFAIRTAIGVWRAPVRASSRRERRIGKTAVCLYFPGRA